MVEKTQYLTQEGKEALTKRLSYLRDVRRVEVAERIRQVLEDGGEIAENTQYEEVKNEQAFLESDISRIENILRYAKLIENTGKTDKVVIGSRVRVIEKGFDDEESYRIVGQAEANPREGKISIESPLGKALLGAKIGDTVKIKAPNGDVIFIIRDIG